MKLEIASMINSDLDSVIRILKLCFPEHNVFELSSDEVREYMIRADTFSKRFGGGVFVGKISGKIVCAVLLKRKSQDIRGKHYFWTINHLAVDPSYRRKGFGTLMIRFVDEKIISLINKKKFSTSKLEAKFVDPMLEKFYTKNGFSIEGKIKSRYRYNETVYIAGKEYISINNK